VSDRQRRAATALPPRASAARERLLAQLPDLRQILRGSLVTRYRRCGRPTCHCASAADPGHGPSHYLMVTVARGQTRLIYVPKQDKAAVLRWIRNFQRAREKLEQISTLNRELLRRGELFRGG
jgi:hypothetical protein